MKAKIALILTILLILSGCGKGGESKVENTITVKSPAFKNMDYIPIKYTGFGEDVSIPLQWGNLPEGTKSVAIVMDDPDAPIGTFTHWIIFNIPPDAHGLSEGVPKKGTLENGAKQGTNDFGRIGYNGPMPPPGKAHRYRIKVYALDTMLSLNSGIRIKEFYRAIKGHVIGEGLLTGLYKR